MIKVKIFTVGKHKEKWLIEALAEYTKRLAPTLTLEWHFVKNSFDLASLLNQESRYVCLDLKGKSLSSEAFSLWLQKEGSRISFVIGGAEGLKEEIVKKASYSLCLSPMTFTHQMARLILVEQIYRAVEIEKGSGYHK